MFSAPMIVTGWPLVLPFSAAGRMACIMVMPSVSSTLRFTSVPVQAGSSEPVLDCEAEVKVVFSMMTVTVPPSKSVCSALVSM